MAHSNRQKLKDARGGKTKHQSLKSMRKNVNRSGFDSNERIRELEAYVKSLNEKSDKTYVAEKVKKVKRFLTNESSKERRKGALTRLNGQLVVMLKNTKDGPIELTEGDVTRIKKEVETLRTRI